MKLIDYPFFSLRKLAKNWVGELTPLEKRTFLLHFTYASLDGFVLGLFVLNEFVFLKSLKGSSFSIGVLFQFTTVMLFFLLFFHEFIRRIRNKKRLLRIMALVTRTPLFIMAFFPASLGKIANLEPWHLLFLGIFLMYYVADPVIFPTINLFLKANYRQPKFGLLYSYSSSSNKVLMFISTFLYGLSLDINPFAFRYIYPVAGMLGIGAIFLLSRVPYTPDAPYSKEKSFWDSVKHSVSTMFGILKDNKPYLDFEIGFMLYGFAYMIIYPVITIFYEKQLHLSYSSVAFYKNVFNILAVILLPFFGRGIGKIDPRKFAAYNFGVMILYILFTGLTQFLPWKINILGIQLYYLLFIAVIFNGFFIAMMALSWYIGSAYFSNVNQAGDYQAVHAFLTGLRAMVAPILGVMFYELAGFPPTFLLAILFLVAAMIVNQRSVRKHPVIEAEFIQ
jgi:hypothetical protein